MKRFVLFLVVHFFAFSTVLATQQIPDILIIGKDTISLEVHPLVYLKVDDKVLELPFPAWHTACWRGHIATWEIIEDNLVLKELNVGNESKFDIVEYLESNGYKPKIINGFVIADWYSETLISPHYASRYNLKNPKFHIDKLFSSFEEYVNKIELVFENGKLITNNILSVESYTIGDKLRCIYCKNECVQIDGIIRENNSKMVRLEILSVKNNKENIQKETIENFDNFWVNPRYCIKILERPVAYDEGE